MVTHRCETIRIILTNLLVVSLFLSVLYPIVLADPIDIPDNPNDPNAWFLECPIYSDPIGDVVLPRGDVGNVWVIDNGTHIMFKVELRGPFNETSQSLVGVGISVSNVTGSNQGGMLNIPIDYSIAIVSNYPEINIVFQDFNNATNTLNDAHLSDNAFWSTSEDNCTITFGYRLGTYHINGTGAVGFLDLVYGQVLNIGFIGVAVPHWWDFIPNQGPTWITYIMGQAPPCPSCCAGALDLVIIVIIVITVVALGTIIAIVSKRHKHPYQKVFASIKDDMKKFDR